MADSIQSLDRLERLARLLDEGKLTRDEYEELKQEIVGSTTTALLTDSGTREDLPASKDRAASDDGVPYLGEPQSPMMRWLAGIEKRPVKPHASHSGRKLTEAEIWFSYQGRIGVGQYWGRFALLLAGNAIVYSAAASDPQALGGLLGLVSLLSIWPGTALAWKRLHDQDKPGAMFLLVLIPLAGPFIWLALSVLGATPGPNTYGPSTGSRYEASSLNRVH